MSSPAVVVSLVPVDAASDVTNDDRLLREGGLGYVRLGMRWRSPSDMRSKLKMECSFSSG